MTDTQKKSPAEAGQLLEEPPKSNGSIVPAAEKIGNLLRVTFFDDRYGHACRSVDLSWRDLCRMIEAPSEYAEKGACPLLKLAAFGDLRSEKNSLRHDANVTAIYGIEGDHDAGTITPEEAVVLLMQSSIEAIVYTSPSHTAAKPRWRVLAPTSQPYAPELRRELAGRLNGVLRGAFSTESFTLSQAYYFGKVAGAPYVAYRSIGVCLDLAQGLTAQYPNGSAVAAARAESFDLSDAPVPEWYGPTDDDDLIRRAQASRSVAATLGTKASFADLWGRNVERLRVAFPDPSRDYDESAADAALVSHLRFWSGAHGERIERLMRRSALRRDKWDRHPDYLRRTIAEILARGGDVLTDEAARRRQQVEEAMRIGEGSDETRLAGTISLEEMLPRFVYIEDGQQVIDLQQPQHVAALADWKAALKASVTTLEVAGKFEFDGTPKTKTYETSGLWEKDPKRQIAKAVTFLAGGRRIVRDPKGREAVNTWNPPDRTAAPGDPALFIEHVGFLFGQDAPRFLDWLAHIEQRPGELPQFGWLHVSDRQGTGRNWISSVIARLWPGYAAVNFDLAGVFRTGFNDRLSSKIIAVVDEINEGANDSKWRNSETMKSLINEQQRTINPKFGRIREEFNACRWLVFSNHRSALALAETDRRFNVVIREGEPKGSDYYAGLYGALRDSSFIAGVAHFLRARDLSTFNPGAHAVMNAAKESVIAANRSEADEILMDVVAHWPSDVILSATLGELLTGQIGGKLTPGHRHALERRGIRARRQPVWLGTATHRVTILRNHERWESADPSAIAAELGRDARHPRLGGAREYLDHVAARKPGSPYAPYGPYATPGVLGTN